MVASVEAVLERLRGEEAPRRLVELAVDAALAEPVLDLLDTERSARSFARALVETAADPGLDARLERAIERSRASFAAGADPVRGRVPDSLVEPVKDLVGRPYAPDPELVRAVLDHPAMRRVLREILVDTLGRFASRVGSHLPDPGRLPGGRRLGAVVGLARGVWGTVVAEVQRQLEGRVSGFVEEAIGRAVQVGIDELTDPDRQGELARWRRDLVDALLDQPADRYHHELHKVGAADSARDLAAVLRGLAAWPELEAWTARRLEQTADGVGGGTLAEALAEWGVADAVWRPALEEAMLVRVRVVLGSQAFEAWLEELLA